MSKVSYLAVKLFSLYVRKRPPETFSRAPRPEWNTQEITVVSHQPTVWYGGPEQTSRTCTWQRSTGCLYWVQALNLEKRSAEIHNREGERKEGRVMRRRSSCQAGLHFCFCCSKAAGSWRGGWEGRERANKIITELKPKPGFLYYTKYVGSSGQTITLSQVLCKGVFQIMSLWTQKPFLYFFSSHWFSLVG